MTLTPAWYVAKLLPKIGFGRSAEHGNPKRHTTYQAMGTDGLRLIDYKYTYVKSKTARHGLAGARSHAAGRRGKRRAHAGATPGARTGAELACSRLGRTHCSSKSPSDGRAPDRFSFGWAGRAAALRRALLLGYRRARRRDSGRGAGGRVHARHWRARRRHDEAALRTRALRGNRPKGRTCWPGKTTTAQAPCRTDRAAALAFVLRASSEPYTLPPTP